MSRRLFGRPNPSNESQGSMHITPLTPGLASFVARLSQIRPQRLSSISAGPRLLLIMSQLSQGLAPPSQLSQLRRPQREEVIKMQLEIRDFLASHNFERATGTMLVSSTLDLPLQKVFSLAFSFLCRMFDPYMTIPGSGRDPDYVGVLKLYDYPFLDLINRLLLAAGGQNTWPRLIQVLFWLVQICVGMEDARNLESSSKQVEGVPWYVAPDDHLDRILIDYNLQSWAEKETTNDPDRIEGFFEEMMARHRRFHQEALDSIANKRLDIEQIRETINSFDAEAAEYAEAEKRRSNLENDFQQLNNYQAHLDKRNSEALQRLEMIHNKNDELENKEMAHILEKEELQARLRAKGANPERILEIQKAKQELQARLAHIASEKEAIDQEAARSEDELNEQLHFVRDAVARYNHQTEWLKLADRTLHVDPVYASSSERTGPTVAPIFANNGLFTQELLALRQVNREVIEEQARLRAEVQHVELEKDAIDERIVELQDEHRSYAAEYAEKLQLFEERKEDSAREAAELQAQADSTKADTRRIEQEIKHNHIELEKQKQEVIRRKREVEHSQELELAEIHRKCIDANKAVNNLVYTFRSALLEFDDMVDGM